MKIRFLGRTIEINNRISIYDFKNEKNFLGTSIRKKDVKTWRGFKKFILYCFAPYECLNNRILKMM